MDAFAVAEVAGGAGRGFGVAGAGEEGVEDVLEPAGYKLHEEIN